MSQSFECLLCKHSFSSVDDPKLKVLSFFLFVIGLVLLFTVWPLALVLFFVIWYGNVPKCPRCKSRKLLRLGESNKNATSELLDSRKTSKKKKGVSCLAAFTGSIVLFLVVSLGFYAWLVLTSPPAPESIYKTADTDLNYIVDEENGYQAVDVRYALQRLTERPIWDYPFYAMKDPQGEGYFGIFLVKSPSGNLDGEVIFLVSEQALNQTEIKDLERSIRYVNGLAADFTGRQIKQATGYSYSDVMLLMDEE